MLTARRYPNQIVMRPRLAARNIIRIKTCEFRIIFRQGCGAI